MIASWIRILMMYYVGVQPFLLQTYVSFLNLRIPSDSPVSKNTIKCGFRYGRNTNIILVNCQYDTTMMTRPLKYSTLRKAGIRQCQQQYDDKDEVSNYTRMIVIINSCTPNATYMRRLTGPTLVQVTDWRLIGNQPLPEPILTRLTVDSDTVSRNVNIILLIVNMTVP